MSKKRTARAGSSRASNRPEGLPVLLNGLTEGQKSLIADWHDAKRGSVRPPAFTDTIRDGTTETYSKADPSEAPQLLSARLWKATGTTLAASYADLLTDLGNVYRKGKFSSHLDIEAALAHMLDIAPRDGLEGMLVTQMVCTHRVAMRKLGVATQPGISDLAALSFTNQASRLLRLFAVQMKALQDYRDGGKPSEQKVSVTHTHVSVQAGANAVIGNVVPPVAIGAPRNATEAEAPALSARQPSPCE